MKRFAWAASIAALAIVSGGPARAQLVYRFGYSVQRGLYPKGGVTFDTAGHLFGTTMDGGSTVNHFNLVGDGTVYEIAQPTAPLTPGKEVPIWNFGTFPGDLLHPFANLTLDGSGNIFGVTEMGGTQSDGGVFELSPPIPGTTNWTESILLSSDSTIGTPQGGLVADAAGNLYGAFAGNAAAFVGGIFELVRPPAGQTQWTSETLYIFTGGIGPSTDGSIPFGSLLVDAAGNLYGTTIDGGTFGNGTVFELSPPAGGQRAWTEQVLYSLDSPKTGGNPMAGLALGAGGYLYGTASKGGKYNDGTVFVLKPPVAGTSGWRLHVLHDFAGPPNDGAEPMTSVTVTPQGFVYGTTALANGDDASGVFELTRPANPLDPWTESFVQSDGKAGWSPGGAVTIEGTKLYGTNAFGGKWQGGTAFSQAIARSLATGSGR